MAENTKIAWCDDTFKGGDISEWPEDLQVREFPQIGAKAE